MNTQTPSTPNLLKLGGLFAATLLLAACASKPEPEPVAEKPVAPPKPKPVLLISSHGPQDNSAAQINFTNGTGKTLQYVMFKTTAYTGEGDLVPSKKSGRRNAWLRVAGPFAPNEVVGNKVWPKVWQHPNLSCFRIEGAELIFADQSVEYHGVERMALLNQSALRNKACGGDGLNTAAQ